MSPRKLDTSPRKHPTQARAKDTVEAILGAATQLFIQCGYEQTTMAGIAIRAGVSVGSLYQYFPNREALVAALIERHADELVRTLRSILRGHARSTLEDCLRASIEATITANPLDPRLHKILSEQVAHVGKLPTAMRANHELTLEIEIFLREHAGEIDPSHDPSVAASVVETVLDAMAHRVLLERGTLSAPVAAREAFALVMRYLKEPRPEAHDHLPTPSR
jgi:AcrR family transcriptional regulator